MKKLIFLIACSGILFYSGCTQKSDMNSVQKKIENGTIEGFQDVEVGLQYYFGIPFAKPPVGEFRWQAPQPAEDWKGVLSTKKFGPKPVQIPVWGDMNSRSDTMSEDCLYLNVWTPAMKGEKGLPVLVYFYGGGYVAGDGAEPRYDGASMAKKGIVTLTVNYRLNIFGFFAHPELSASAPYNTSGNYGLLDQNAALKWVQANIEVFGGDPKRVTIAGESAGSISVSAQMASPLSKNLIAGAIGESGAGINPTMASVSLQEGETEGLKFIEESGLKSFSELKAMTTDEIVELYRKSGRFGFPTVIDGYFYPKTITEIFTAKEQAQVPLLLGWNSAEIPGFAFTQGPYTEQVYLSKVKEAYPNDYETVLKLYPYSTEREIELSSTALASDRFISYSTWKWFDLHRKNSDQAVYRYLFCKVRPNLVDKTLESGLAGGTAKKEDNGVKMPEPVGAAHASEIEYCMGNLYLAPEFAWTEEDHKVSETMLNFFANFIITGSPNGENLPEWPAAEANDDTPPVMIIDVNSAAADATDDGRYLFLDKSYGN